MQNYPGQKGNGPGPVSHVLPSHGEGGWKENIPVGGQEEEKVCHFQLSDVHRSH